MERIFIISVCLILLSCKKSISSENKIKSDSLTISLIYSQFDTSLSCKSCVESFFIIRCLNKTSSYLFLSDSIYNNPKVIAYFNGVETTNFYDNYLEKSEFVSLKKIDTIKVKYLHNIQCDSIDFVFNVFDSTLTDVSSNSYRVRTICNNYGLPSR